MIELMTELMTERWVRGLLQGHCEGPSHAGDGCPAGRCRRNQCHHDVSSNLTHMHQLSLPCIRETVSALSSSSMTSFAV